MPIVDTSLRSESSSRSTARDRLGPRARRRRRLDILLLLARWPPTRSSQASPSHRCGRPARMEARTATVDPGWRTSTTVDDTMLITVTGRRGRQSVRPAPGTTKSVLIADLSTSTGPGAPDGPEADRIPDDNGDGTSTCHADRDHPAGTATVPGTIRSGAVIGGAVPHETATVLFVLGRTGVDQRVLHRLK